MDLPWQLAQACKDMKTDGIRIEKCGRKLLPRSGYKFLKTLQEIRRLRRLLKKRIEGLTSLHEEAKKTNDDFLIGGINHILQIRISSQPLLDKLETIHLEMLPQMKEGHRAFKRLGIALKEIGLLIWGTIFMGAAVYCLLPIPKPTGLAEYHPALLAGICILIAALLEFAKTPPSTLKKISEEHRAAMRKKRNSQ